MLLLLLLLLACFLFIPHKNCGIWNKCRFCWQCWIFVAVLPSVHGFGWQRIIPILSCLLCAVLMLLCACTWKTGRVWWCVNKLIIVYDIIHSLDFVNLALHLRRWLLLSSYWRKFIWPRSLGVLNIGYGCWPRCVGVLNIGYGWVLSFL